MFHDIDDLGDDARRAVEEMERHAGVQGVPGECSPAIDVFETAGTFEIVVDLPGVPTEAVRVIARSDVVLVVGEKTPTFCPVSDATFHLVERGFGRFARTIRLAGACDTARAVATLEQGELRIVIPRIEERRGSEIVVPIRRPPTV
jgi:HSP20 family protein